ncbi:hypothetical protein [Kibdelosporangium philippinense]|uniref:hypothetical protein n=1 Tax=Kibdelosporangium philippinense TaxID=211113 RepID=UPI00360EC3CF
MIQEESTNLYQPSPKLALCFTRVRPTLVLMIRINHRNDETSEIRVQAAQARIKNAFLMRIHFVLLPLRGGQRPIPGCGRRRTTSRSLPTTAGRRLVDGFFLLPYKAFCNR